MNATVFERHNNFTLSGNWEGRSLRLVSDGAADYRWVGSNTAIYFTGHTSLSLTQRFYDHRGLIATHPLEPESGILEFETFTCDATNLVEADADGSRVVWTRVNEAKVGVYG